MLCNMTFVIVQRNHIHPVHGNSRQAREKNRRKKEIEPEAHRLTTNRLTRDQNSTVAE